MPSTEFLKEPIRLAMIEMNSQSDIYFNLVAIEYATAQAATRGAKFVIVPENAFSFGNHKVASRHFDALKDWCGKLASTYNIHFVAGSLPCSFRPDGTPVPENKYRQTSLLFDPAGDCVARYDKIHLFKATIKAALPSDATKIKGIASEQTVFYDESKTFEAGNTPVVANTALGKIGMMVCFDLRFAQMAKYLRQQGADILTAPSSFVYETGKLHWQTLLQARALDAQCLLIGLGQTGTHYLPAKPRKMAESSAENYANQANFSIHSEPHQNSESNHQRRTWGHSQFINANGQVMTMQTCQANPFSSHPEQADLAGDIATPLAKQALSWLNADNHSDAQVLHIPQTVTLHMSDFDPVEQDHFRHSIILPQSERFGIVSPSE